MGQLKSARHHWWPESLSAFWKDAEGCVHRLTPDGTLRRAPPKNFGVLGNGHLIRLGPTSADQTPWDQDYEAEFQKPDNQVPNLIRWLETLRLEERLDRPAADRFVAESMAGDRAAMLFETMISLAVRSPRTREKSVGLAERFRGPLPPHERRAILGLNHRYIYRSIVSHPPRYGKFVVLFSPHREFIFGDGFFHNISGQSTPLGGLKVLVPLTPTISVLFVNPTSYRVEPRLMTFALSAAETDTLNDAVQTYSKSEIFYRAQRPEMIEAFRLGQHFIWSDPRNPIDTLIDTIPGVDPRDLSLHDHLEAMRQAHLIP